MKCPECGSELQPGKQFCGNCGARVPEAPPQATATAPSFIPAAGARVDLPDPAISYTGQSRSGVQYQMIGTTLQAVSIQLKPGQTIYSESGGMAWMSANVHMETRSAGGLGKMLGRALSGESLFLVDFTCPQGQGVISFASEFPGKIVPLDLGPGQEIIAQKDAFMCAEKSVELTMHFRKRLGAGFFGGEGFILQKLTGPGLAFVELDGEIVEYTLEAGQVMMVDTGFVAMYEPTVDFDIEMVRGVKNIFFGGEGLFLARMRGPGRIWLQTMPMYNLARKIAAYVSQHSGGSTGGSVAGGVVKGLLGS